ncbi:MAG: hypothetical protein RI897_2754 [Verrucomicrobiota bacterium]
MTASSTRVIRAIDSHTGGEPTRVVLSGGPDLGPGSVADQTQRFRQIHDAFRRAICCEPRGSDILVSALLCPPANPSCTSGIIFFNNVGYLGMCGHGTIGVVATLAYLQQLQPGQHHFETPVGIITTTLHPDGSVSVQNVPSWRQASNIAVLTTNHGTVRGDIAYGGNWFFLTHDHQLPIQPDNIPNLTALSRELRRAVNSQGFPAVDHIKLLAPPSSPQTHSRSFVLCPGEAYDRSPCGTGTSAHLACLAADQQWPENQAWIQESVLGSTFEARYRWLDPQTGRIEPTIRGTAFITAETQLLLQPNDPFQWGL